MKIALVCNEYPPRPHGGIGTFVHVLAHGLTARGHSVSVVGLGDRSGKWVGERDDHGVHVVTLRRPHLSQRLVGRRPIFDYLRDESAAGRIDLVETPDFLGPVPYRMDACPVVVRLHNTSTAMARHNGRRPRPSNHRSERRQLCVHRDWIAVSRHALHLTLRTFPECTPDRTAVIHSPVTGGGGGEPPPAPLPQLPDDFVLHAGHVVARKGVVVLAHAARRFLEEFPHVHLVYAGGVLREDRVPADALVRDALGERLGRRCHFLGYVSRPTVLECMRRARVLAFPSTLEMFPLVVLEAMAQGCPVVASAIPPFSEIITHGRTGLLADPACPPEVAAAVSTVLRDPSLARSMVANARAFVAAQCSLDRHLDATLAFYERCRGGHGTDRAPARPEEAVCAQAS